MSAPSSSDVSSLISRSAVARELASSGSTLPETGASLCLRVLSIFARYKKKRKKKRTEEWRKSLENEKNQKYWPMHKGLSFSFRCRWSGSLRGKL